MSETGGGDREDDRDSLGTLAISWISLPHLDITNPNQQKEGTIMHDEIENRQATKLWFSYFYSHPPFSPQGIFSSTTSSSFNYSSATKHTFTLPTLPLIGSLSYKALSVELH